jgi:hypothetical protein
MKNAQSQAYTRLFKKLSALRATLPNDERAILDRLIVVNEVSAHKMNTKANTRANTKASEVSAHKMNTKANTKATPQIAFDPNSEQYKIQE